MLSSYTKRSLAVLAFLAATLGTQAAWNFSQTSVTVNASGNTVARAGGYNSLGQPTFSNIYLGSFNSSGTLMLNSGMVRTATSGGGNACSAIMYYRLYRSGDAAPAWTTVALPNMTNLGGGVNQWDSNALNVNLLSGMTSATYYLEVRWAITGHSTCGTCCTSQLFDASSSQGYRAYLDYDITESFTDQNFTASPTWTGETSSFRYIASTNASAGGSNSRSARLRAPNSGAGTQHMRVANTVWSSTEQHWSFWFGNRSNSFSNTNNTAIWLWANEANLESATVDGYRIFIGDNTGGDEIFLQSVTNGVGTNVITSAAINNGLTDIGVAIHVQRIGTTWTLFTSTLPTANSMGPTALASPMSVATVNQGSAVSATYTPAGTGYYGIVCQHGSSRNERRNIEFDAFRLYAVFAAQTTVSFASVVSNKIETDGSITIPLSIANPSAILATNATVTLTSGAAARIGGFTSQVVAFPAGSSANQNLNITITNNSLCDDEATLVFTITTVTGGTLAVANNPISHTLVVVDDNMDYKTLLDDDFETGNVNAWTQSSPAMWYADNSEPLSDSYSIRHTDTGSGGTAWASTPLGNVTLDGVTTVWRCNLSHFDTEPDHQDKYLVFLTANENDLFSSTVDGYAVGINPANGAAPDLITLWQIDNGAPGTAIVTSAVDWNNTHAEIGIEVSRTDAGVWTMKLNENGGFDLMTNAGSGTNTAYNTTGYTGLRYTYKASTSGMLAMDDFSIVQKGCKVTYYSQSNGNVNAPIWATVPVGAPSAALSSRLSSFVVQNGHTVSLTTDWIMDDLNIQNTGALSMGAQELKVHDDVQIDGSLSAGTSTLSFVGEVNQDLMHAALLTLYNLKIENTLNTVTLASNAFVNVQNMVMPESGTLQTNGKLTLVSTASKTAAIGEIKSGADVLGNITMERYIPALTNYPYGSWTLAGCPLQGCTIADWNDDIITTGFAGSDFPPPYTFINIQNYNEAASGDAGQGYQTVANITDALHSVKGYSIYMQTPAQLLDVTGSIYKNTFDTPLSFTDNSNAADGWNLLVNQYPSMVDFQQLANAGIGVASYYLYDAEMNNYKTYNAGSGVGTAPKFINSSQAFFVKASAPGASLHYQENYKVNNNTPFERNEEFSSNFTFTLSSFNNTADQCIVHFNPMATAGYEWSYDAEKLFSMNDEAVNCALLSADSVMLTIDSRPYMQNEASIPVYASFPVPGTYTFLVNECHNLPFGSCLYVEDLITGNTIAVQSDEQLEITTDAPWSGIRFIIHTSPALLVNVSDMTCSNADNGQIVIEGNTADWSIALHNEIGVVITSTDNYNFQNMEAGDYEIILTSYNTNCQSSQMYVSIEEPADNYIEVVNTTAAWCNATETGAMQFYIGCDECEYTVTNSSNELVATGTATQEELTLENLAAGVYTIHTSNVCGTYEAVADLRDPLAVSTDILDDDISIQLVNGTSQTVAIEQITTGATTWYWSLDDGTESTEEVFVHNFTQPGEYTLMLLAANEQCSAADFTHISVTDAVGITEIENAAYISVLNTQSEIQCTLQQSANGGLFDIKIFDMGGKLLISQQQQIQNGQMVSADISSFPNGAYTAVGSLDGRSLLSKKFMLLRD
ncbi:MAG: PKD domain-containing protein [Flavobacteriales bacterium]